MSPHILYRFYDADNDLLYVGITNSPTTRFNRHSFEKLWVKDVTHSTMEHFPSRAALAEAEIRAIQTEKPRYNVMHSVVPAPKQIKVTKKATVVASRDANRFPRPGDLPTVDREARLNELQHQLAWSRRYLIPRTPCPSCDYILLTREYDGLIRCLNCAQMWTHEELPLPDWPAMKQEMESFR